MQIEHFCKLLFIEPILRYFVKEFLKRLSVFVIAIVITLAVCISISHNFTTPKTTEMSYDNLQQPQSWVGLYLAGQHAIRKSNFAEASEYFAKSLDERGADNMMESQVMGLLLATGKYDQALKIANTLKKDESGIAELLQYAEKIKGEDYSGAIEVLDKLVEDNENSVIHKILRAWANVGLKQNEVALQIMQDLTKEQYFKNLIYYNYALIAEFVGDNQKTTELYKFLTANQKIPTKIAEKAHDFFVKIGDKANAKKIMAKDFNKDSINNYSPIVSAQQGVADTFIELGAMLIAEQNYSKAIGFFRLGLLIEPQSDEALLLLGTIFVNEKDFKTSNQILKQVSEKSNFYDMAQVSIAGNYKDMGNEVAAKQYLDKLAKNPETKLQALVNLGDLAREQEDFLTAKNYYTQAITEIEQGKPNPAFWGIYFARGVCSERLKNWEEAEQDFKTALKLEPDQPDLLNYYGYSLLDLNLTNRIDDAKEMLIKAQQQRPDDPHITDSIGWLWFKKGDYTKAVRFLERAAAQMPYDATINEHLGDVYWRLGREKEATYAWQRALENNPEQRFVEGLEAKLKFGLDYTEQDITNAEKVNVKIESAR